MRIDCDTCGSNRQKTHCVLGMRSANPKRWRSAPKTQFILPPWGDQTGTLSATTHQRTMLSNSRNDVPITGLDFHALHDSNAVRLDTHRRSEEHTSELPSLMRISYAVFCLTKKNMTTHNITI